MEPAKDSAYYELVEKTKVFCTPPAMKLKPTVWPVGYVERVCEGGKVIGYRMEPANARYISSLPDEFFNHQAADIDLSDESAIFSFVEKWGFPFTPRRTDPALISELFASAPSGGNGEQDDSIRKTLHVLCSCETHHNFAAGQYPVGFQARGAYPFDAFAISIEEVRESLAIVQRARNLALDWIREGEDANASWQLWTYFNAAMQHPLRIPEIDFPISEESAFALSDLGFLTQAMANQFAETINDETAWWRACVKCGRLFKRKQVLSDKKNPNKRRSTSIYCSEKCHANKVKPKSSSKTANPAQ